MLIEEGYPCYYIVILLWFLPAMLIFSVGRLCYSEKTRQIIEDARRKGEFINYYPKWGYGDVETSWISGIFALCVSILAIIALIIKPVRLDLPIWLSLIIILANIGLQIRVGLNIDKIKGKLTAELEDGTIKLKGWWKVFLLDTPHSILNGIFILLIFLNTLNIIKILLHYTS